MTTDEPEDLMSVIRQGRVRVGPRSRALALILHGGRAVDPRMHRSRDVSYLRMLPFVPAVSRISRGLVAPVLVHNRHGGWIAPSGTGLVQTRELVHRLSDEHGLPVVLLGHSEHLREKVVRVIHGEADAVCSPQRSRDFVERLRAAGGDATYVGVTGGGHALLDRPWRWHGLAARAVMDVVGST